MENFKKIVYALNTVILFLFSLVLLAAMISPQVAQLIGIDLKFNIWVNPTGRLWDIIIVWVVFFLAFLGIILFFARGTSGAAIYKTSEIGALNITIKAIENIACTEARKLSGIKINKAIVKRVGDGVSVFIKAAAQMEENIPEISADIQVRVKEAIEKYAEVKVASVKVIIVDIYAQNKPRVE